MCLSEAADPRSVYHHRSTARQNTHEAIRWKGGGAAEGHVSFVTERLLGVEIRRASTPMATTAPAASTRHQLEADLVTEEADRRHSAQGPAQLLVVFQRDDRALHSLVCLSDSLLR